MQDDAIVLHGELGTTVFVGRHLTVAQQMVAAVWLAADSRDPSVQLVRWPRGQVRAVAHVIADERIAELLQNEETSIEDVEAVIYALAANESAA